MLAFPLVNVGMRGKEAGWSLHDADSDMVSIEDHLLLVPGTLNSSAFRDVTS